MWNDDVLFCGDDPGKVKVIIMTTILDQRENWCFDLKKIPEKGKLKVIYSNGTIKNIEFDGEFKRVEIFNKFYLNYLPSGGGYHRKVYPVAYRKM